MGGALLFASPLSRTHKSIPDHNNRINYGFLSVLRKLHLGRAVAQVSRNLAAQRAVCKVAVVLYHTTVGQNFTTMVNQLPRGMVVFKVSGTQQGSVGHDIPSWYDHQGYQPA